MGSITYDRNGFIVNGERTLVMAGGLHYFRIPPDLWRERLEQVKACGLNAVSTYVAWNFHETSEGEYDFTGAKDLGRFLDLAHELGLHAVVRAGPYICAEWYGGGIPAWLAARGVRLRSSDPVFLDHVRRWYVALDAVLRPRQITTGGAVLMVQVENEFTYLRRQDPAYFTALAQMHRENAVDLPFFTCEKSWWLRDAWAPGIIPASDFGSGACEQLARVRAFDNDAPLYVPEFYPGWMTTWGNSNGIWPAPQEQEKNFREKGLSVAKELLEIAAHGAGFNYYMFHGGTNFGFWASKVPGGSDYFHTTSYDFQAPVNEEGAYTCKFHLLKRVHAFITRHMQLLLTSQDAPEVEQRAGTGIRALIRRSGKQTTAYLRNLTHSEATATVEGQRIPLAPDDAGIFILTGGAITDRLLVSELPHEASDLRHTAALPQPLQWTYNPTLIEAQPAYDDRSWLASPAPRQLAAFGVNRGYGWYRCDLAAQADAEESLGFLGCADRANVYVNGAHAAALGSFAGAGRTARIRLKNGVNKLALLVEDKGRQAFGAGGEPKGLTGEIWRSAAELFLCDWRYATGATAKNATSPTTFPAPDHADWQPLTFTPLEYPHREPEEIRASLLADEYTLYVAQFDLPAQPALARLTLRGEPDATEVWLNGERTGLFRGWDDGMEIHLDVAPLLRAGRNVLHLRTRNTDRKVLPVWQVALLCGDEILRPGEWRMGGAPDGELCPPLAGWSAAPANAAESAKLAGHPVFWRTAFTLDEPRRCTVVTAGLSTGYLVCNGRNLGRYNECGPQTALYLPRSFTHAGRNELTIFEEGGRVPDGVRIETVEYSPPRA